jgi:glycerophosphoryl diester phosphodiesterase
MLRKILKGVAIFLGTVLLIAVLVFGIAVWLSEPIPEHPFFSHVADDRVLVLAHQGGDGEWPSNTLFAFQNAAELGVDMLEMDVHMSSDGEIVVIHDDTVDRTTDGTGEVSAMSLAELQALDAGYDWPTVEGHPDLGTDTHPYRGQEIRIPTLKEIFLAFPDYPMSIEIKQNSPSMAEPLCALIREYEREEWVIIASFRETAMLEFRAACPEIATMAIQPEVTMYYALNTAMLSAAWQPATHAFAVPEYFGDLHVLTESFVANTKQHNVRVYPWTINTAEDMQKMIDLGVDGLITDYPTLAMELTRESKE